MPIEGFDYKAFAVDLANQAGEILNKEGGTNAAPTSLTDAEKKAIIDTVRKFCLMVGDALSKEDKLNFNAQQASIITQFIGEWTFHKSIDILRANLPIQYRESILQKIAFTIFEIAKQGILKQLPQDELIEVVEHHVIKVWKETLNELQEKDAITQSCKQEA